MFSLVIGAYTCRKPFFVMPRGPTSVSVGTLSVMEVSPPFMFSSPARSVISSASALGAVSPDHSRMRTFLSGGASRSLMYWLDPTISRRRSMV